MKIWYKPEELCVSPALGLLQLGMEIQTIPYADLSKAQQTVHCQ